MKLYSVRFINLLTGFSLLCFAHVAYADGVVAVIENEKAVSGVVTGSSVDTYSFNVAQPNSFVMSVSEKGKHFEGFMPSLQLKGPDGNITDGGAQPFFYHALSISPAAGKWTVEISRQDGGKSGGAYELILLKVPTSKGLAMEFGKSYSGSITRGAVDVYTIKAQPGVVVGNITLTAKSRAGFLPEGMVFGPNGEMLSSAGCTDSCSLDVPMSNTDVYTVMIRRTDASDTKGDYTLSAQAIGDGGTMVGQNFSAPAAASKTNAVSMKFGKSYAGNIMRGTVDTYIINGTPGVLGRITLTPKSGTGFTPEVAVLDPSGQMVNSAGCTDRCDIDVEMTQHGNYTVMLGRRDRGDTKGSYTLSVARSNGEIEQPKVDVSRVFMNPTVPVWPDRLLAMEPVAYMYIGSSFVRFSQRQNDSLETKDGNLSPLVQSSAWYRLVVDQASKDADVEQADKYLTGSGASQDFEQAKKLYLKAAERGIAPAQFNLAVLYAIGVDEAPDFAKAAKWYGKAAEQGLVVAQNNLGDLYHHGQGIAQDNAAAIKWYEKAANSGYPPALYRLGILAAEGRGMPKDTTKAIAWLKVAAASGDVNAQAMLAMLEGRTKEALQLWRKNAAVGDIKSLQNLVEAYRQNGVSSQDYDEVLEIYRNASNEVNPYAFVGIADLFAKQNPPDYFEAYYWYSLTVDAAKGAYMLPDEKKTLVKYASDEASKLAKKLSAEQVAVTKWRINDRHPQELDETLKKAAEIFLRGQEAAAAGDYESSLLFYLQAADKGLARAQLMLGHVFKYDNPITSRDIDKALVYYKQSVQNGIVEGASMIAGFYEFGLGVPRDLQTAVMWYEMDASRGFQTAIDHLAAIYLSGYPDGGKKAIAMYEKAAARDMVEANAALGMVYLYGLGDVPADRQKALKWYLKSADKGDTTGAIQAAAILMRVEPRDYDRARNLLNSFGSPVALNNRGYMVEHGLGDKVQDAAKGQAMPTAMELYKQAADECYGRAMYNVGRLIATGSTAPAISATPIVKDDELARKWMESGAHYGSQAASVWLDLHDVSKAKFGTKIPQTEITLPPEGCPKKGKQ